MTRPRTSTPLFCPCLLVSLCLLAFTVSIPAPAQTPLPPPAPPAPSISAPEPIPVTVTVRDKKGRIITDLTREEFRILVDRQEQAIASFHGPGETPLVVGLLLDSSGSMRSVISPELETALVDFVRLLVARNAQVFLVAFGSKIILLGDVTTDLPTLEHGIRQWRQVVRGTTALHDAIYWACEQKLAAYPIRRALVLVTDGIDNSSGKRMGDAGHLAVQTNTSISNVAVISRQRTGVRSPEFDLAMDDLYILARETSGILIDFRMSHEYAPGFLSIAKQFEGQYLLSFVPPIPQHPRKLRKIQVEVTRKDARVTARKAY